MFPGPDPGLKRGSYLKTQPIKCIRCCLELSAGRNLMDEVNSQNYFMGQRRLLSCQNQSCPPVVLNYTFGGAIKQPIRAAPENRTWVRVVGLLCLQPQSPVHWRTSTTTSASCQLLESMINKSVINQAP